ncbi:MULTISPECIES: ParA family protein [unclassified Modicisalibacter]|uniref:ParA family protein n=1 Tax=unclassified Modicisalibacter TaxID=2679913 RepID=UPI001CCFFD61|nr:MULTISPECIES: ParA family protein [unclassified Modicisalibacter]MBZ9559029.1 ParA family protein [Modicisalibacter sp. R2A 31.J]MBZ9576859.1 ParA family protein [Modicisalibacter sp. MOD 31.J]
MRVVATVCSKGGVGKTTTTANLGGLLADAGFRVLLVDLDSQPTLSSYYDLSQPAPGGVYELFATDLVDLDKIISRTSIPGLDIIVSNDHRNQLQQLLLNAPNGRFRLVGLLDRFADRYDVILIDTQGARSILLEMAVLASDHLVSPIVPELLTAREFVRGTQGMLNELRELALYTRFDVPPVSILLNKMTDQLRDARDISESIRGMYAEVDDIGEGGGIRVLDTPLVNLSAYRRAALDSLPVHRVEPRKPSSRKALACADQIKAVAADLFPEWADAIRAVGAVKPNGNPGTGKAGGGHVH